MFENIKAKKDHLAKLQEATQKGITKRRKGRPRRPNMHTYCIKMDKALHAKVTQKAQQLHTTNSFIISYALRKFFKEKELLLIDM